MEDPKYDIPEGRKALYYLGMGLVVVGILLFMSVFITSINLDPFSPSPSFTAAPIGMVLMVVGGVMRTIGARGLAGSGVVLDPQRAKDELEPYARAAGGLVQDVLEETELTKDHNEPLIKVRCRNCQTLNDETANYCNHCGKPL